MSNDDLSLHDLAPIYALDALDGEELAAFEAHLAACDACQDDVASFRDTAAELGHAVEVEPPPELRQELLDRVASTPRAVPADLEAHRRRRFSPARALLAAAAALVVIAGGIAFVARDTADPLDSYTALVGESDVVVTELAGTEGATASVSVAWSPERDRVGVSAAGLDDPPEGQVYALWLLPAVGDPVPAALFEPDGGLVSTVAPIEDLDSTGWGITLEPIGGSDEPTLPIIYVGSL